MSAARGQWALQRGAVAVVVVVVVLAASAAGSAKPPPYPPWPTITLLAAGPNPASITVTAGKPLAFRLAEGESKVVFDGVACGDLLIEIDPCSVTIHPPRFLAPTVRLWRAGTFSYQVLGSGPGTGTVIVRPSGHIEAVSTTVMYGQRARLQGRFFSSDEWVPPGRVVRLLVLERRFGLEVFAPATVTRTNRLGRWHAWVAPRIETSYHLQNDDMDQSSEDVVVHVRPKVTLRAASRRAFVTRVRAQSSYAGKLADVERLELGAWTTMRTVRLDSRSSARFHLSGLAAGTRIRVVVLESQAQPGYVAGFSRSLRLAS